MPLVDELLSLFADSEVEEVFLNSTGEVQVRAKGVVCPVGVEIQPNLSEAFAFAEAQGQRLTGVSPSVGGIVKGTNIRWNMVVPPASDSLAVSLRRPLPGQRLGELLDGVASPSRLGEICSGGDPLIICGYPGSGKTTLLRGVLNRYFFSLRTIIIENQSEIVLDSPAWVKLLTCQRNHENTPDLSMCDLVGVSLRMSPDRVVLAEVRPVDFNAIELLARMRSAPFMATIHGDSLSVKSFFSKIYDGGYFLVECQRTQDGSFVYSFNKVEKPMAQI